jgi:hypothetical protein
MQHLGYKVPHERMGVQGTSCGFWAWNEEAPFMPCSHRQERLGGKLILSDRGIEFKHMYHLARHPLKVMRSMPATIDRKGGKFVEWFLAMGFVEQWDAHKASLRYWVRTHEKLLRLQLHQVRIGTDYMEMDWRRVAYELKLPQMHIPDIPITNTYKNGEPVTWNDLYSIDKEYAERARRMIPEFGFEE